MNLLHFINRYHFQSHMIPTRLVVLKTTHNYNSVVISNSYSISACISLSLSLLLAFHSVILMTSFVAALCCCLCGDLSPFALSLSFYVLCILYLTRGHIETTFLFQVSPGQDWGQHTYSSTWDTAQHETEQCIEVKTVQSDWLNLKRAGLKTCNLWTAALQSGI